MPRKSAAALSVIAPPSVQKRPEPPAELTQEQATEWRIVVERLPAEWFPAESHQLLVAYCRHVVRARVVAGLIDSFKREHLNTDDGLHRYDKLAQMADREGRAISSLATRMRLSQQSRYRHDKAATKTEDPKASAEQWRHVA
jgi:hypothetical protein